MKASLASLKPFDSFLRSLRALIGMQHPCRAEPGRARPEGSARTGPRWGRFRPRNLTDRSNWRARPHRSVTFHTRSVERSPALERLQVMTTEIMRSHTVEIVPCLDDPRCFRWII